MSAAALNLHSSGLTGAGAGFGLSLSDGGLEAGGLEPSEAGGGEAEECSSFEGVNDGERIAKDPTAAT